MTDSAGHEVNTANASFAGNNGVIPPKTAEKPTPTRPKPKRTETMNGPLYMQNSQSNVVLVRRLKRKDDGTWRHLARWFVENQIGLSFNLLSLLFLAHACIPKARIHTRKFFALSYYNQSTEKYAIGTDDGFLIVFYITVFTLLRAGTMEYILAPLAKWRGISKPKDLTRFSEQAWLLIYYSVFWPLGMYIYCESKYFLDMKELWTNWPDRELQGLIKGYVLAQLAFWLQQIIVINIEERRKDHWQMFTHHIITITLLWACYSYHHARVGNLILVLMDVVDLFLPLAKCLKYIGHSTLCDIMFGLFMLSWVVARHIFYMMVVWSIYSDVPKNISMGCYRGPSTNVEGPLEPPSGYMYLVEPFFSSQGYVCLTQGVQWTFLTLLLSLQVITIMWFFLIVRVAIRVIRGDGGDDPRSDDEEVECEEDEGEFVYEEARPLEEEVTVDEIDFKNWERRTGVKRQASASGVSLPGHSDRKELLGRIGCEKHFE